MGGLERQGTESAKQSDQQTAAIAKKDGGEWTEVWNTMRISEVINSD
jgi:hypothetical protein